MKYWLIKSEAAMYSIDDLKRDKRSPWTEIRNYQARNFMRDEMQIGDRCIFYHSSSEPSGAAGIARVASAPHPDETQFEKGSEYFEPKATREKPIWMLVDVAFEAKFKRFVPIEELRADAALKNMRMWKANRLSVVPLTKTEFERIMRAGERSR